MQIKTKQRLVGVLVLLAMLAIFLPLVFHNSHPAVQRDSFSTIPPKPQMPKVQQVQEKESAVLPVLSMPSQSVVQQEVQQSKLPSESKAAALQKEQQSPLSANKILVKSEQKRLTQFMEAPQAWCVQLGTFHNINNANILISKLRKAGYDAYTRPILNTKGEHLLRVYVGPEVQEESAERLRDKLEASLHIKGIVCKYKIET